MGLLDEALAYTPDNIDGTDLSFVDGDTASNASGSKSYRLEGIEAAEVEKIIHGKYKPGEAGGAATTDIMRETANKLGFTNVKLKFNPDGSPEMDTLGKRQMFDLVNDEGDSYKTSMLNAGAFDIGLYNSNMDILNRDIYEAQRTEDRLSGDGTLNDFDLAALDIRMAGAEEGAKTLGFKKTLETEKERSEYINYFMQQGMSRDQATSEMGKYFNNSVAIRKAGVSIDNESLNPISDNWNKGWTSVGESAFGVLNLGGYKSGAEGVESWGKNGVRRQQAKLAAYGNTLNNYKDIESVGQVFEYLGNMMAMSLPFMAVTAAATVAAPVTFGASYLVPVSMFTGQVWNEMEGPNEDKSATAAIGGGIAMTVLDRLGLKGLGGASKSPVQAIQEAANKLAKERGIPLGEAKGVVKQEVDVAVAEFAEQVEAMAKNQLKAKATAMRVMKTIGVGATAEGLTEVGQEAIGYLAAVKGSNKVFDAEEFQERITNAALAGTALGGVFSAPGTAKDQLGWMDAAARYGEAATPSEVEGYTAIEISNHGTVRTNAQVLLDQKREIKNLKDRGVGVGFNVVDRDLEHKEKNKGKTTMERASETVMDAHKLWRASVTSAIPKRILDKSASARAMASLLGGVLTPLHGGSGIEAAQHHLVTAYKNYISEPEPFYKSMGLMSVAGVFRSSSKRKISNDIYKILNDPKHQTNGQFDGSKVSNDPAYWANFSVDIKNRSKIVNLGNQMVNLGVTMRKDQVIAGANMGDIDNYLFKYKGLDKNAVSKDQKLFKALLMSEFNMSAAEAQRITDEVIDNPLVSDLSDVLGENNEVIISNVGSLNPSAHKKRTIGLSENSKFNDAGFFESDIFANIATAAKSAARYSTQMEYVGKDAEIISHLLNKMQAEGVSDADVNKVASDVKDILEAMAGNYKRPTTEMGKKLMRFQKNVMFWMTLSALPLATFSSLPEMAMTQGALTSEQIYGKNGSIRTFAAEAVAAFLPALKKVENETDEGILKIVTRSKGQEVFQQVGLGQWEVGAATTSGVSMASEGRQQMMQAFFRAIGLTQWTDYTRSVRGAMAFDFISYNSKLVAMRDLGYTKATREAQEAEQKLRSLGIPVEQFAELMYQYELYGDIAMDTEVKKQFWEQTITEASYNFINQAVALPGAANRPLIYQDPRFALFTQFQGFISTFTANQLPRMWNDYVKRGTPTMRYNTFVLMATMIALGFFAQGIKDSIKFDDDDDEGTLGNPYLDKPEYIRRGVMASGLFGTSERVIDMFAPIYGQRSNGVGGWLYNQTTGESPTVGYVARGGEAALKLAQGDVEGALYNTLKMSPGIGPFTDKNKSLASLLTGGGWNYKDNKENQ